MRYSTHNVLNDFLTERDISHQFDAAILYFPNVFETMPHDKLLHSLHQYGVQGLRHTWLTKLTRRIKTIVEYTASGDNSVTSRVPQGRILCPMLTCHLGD